MKIKPTIGRVVWYWPFASNPDKDQPWPALICYVHSDQCINIAGFEDYGAPFAMANVYLAQEGEPIPTHGGYAAWMPYQVGQAKKHAEDDAKQIEARTAETASVGLQAGDAAAAAVQKPGTQRVSLQKLKDRVADIQYRRPVQAPHATVCEILLDNGYFLVGVSAPADPANFNEALGQQYAYEDAMRKLWPIQGFMLVENLFRSKLLGDPRQGTGEDNK